MYPAKNVHTKQSENFNYNKQKYMKRKNSTM